MDQPIGSDAEVGWLPLQKSLQKNSVLAEFFVGAARGGENLGKGFAKKAAKSNARVLLYITSCRVGGRAPH